MEGYYIFMQREKDGSMLIFETETEKMNKYSSIALAKAVHSGKIKIYGFTDANKKINQPFTFSCPVQISPNTVLSMAICYTDIYMAIKSYLDDKQAKNQQPNPQVVQYKMVLEQGSQKFHDYLQTKGYL